MRTLFLFFIMVLAQAVNAQTCNTAIVADAPNTRYKITTSTVLDKQTGLVWMRCAVGQTWSSTVGCTGTPTMMNWQTALQTAESTTFAGKSDWRLPNQKELQSLIESRCSEPAININVFQNATTDGLWSSSPNAHNSNNAWLVDFFNGNDGDETKDISLAVRLVRGGQ
jgi:hypothetical protein